MSKRLIWSFEIDIGKATETAATLREGGRATRIYKRTLRAEGLVCYGYVVVTDAEAGWISGLDDHTASRPRGSRP